MTQANSGYDLVIVGSGPGGYTAAVRASQLGMKTAIVEMDSTLGGICLNWGCIPTKALLKQAEMYRLFQRAEEFGFSTGKVAFDWQKLISRSRDVSGQLAKGVSYLMNKGSIEVIHGKGRLTVGKEVEVFVEGSLPQKLETANILLATGGHPLSIPGVTIDGENVLSSKEAMVLASQPESIAIIGAGAIGIEFAYFFNSFGTKVTVLEAESQVLPREDEEIAGVLEQSLIEQGIDVHTGVKVSKVEVSEVGKGKLGSMEVAYGGGDDGDQKLNATKVLMAVGVGGNVEGLGLEAACVQTERGAIVVNGRMETNIKGIFAIGDVVGPPQLAHVASAEAVAAVEFMAGKERPELARDSIPGCVYCQPQVASVGLTEKDAIAAGHDVRVGRFPFAASGKARAIGETEGLVKLVFEAQYGELLGASIVGSEATEMIAELGLARTLEATHDELLQTVHAHPTLSEAVMEAAGEALGEAINI